MISKIDDFFVTPSLSELSGISEEITTYMEYLSKIPTKLKSSPDFDKASLFNELCISNALYRKSKNASEPLTIYWLSKLRNEATIISVKENIPVFNFTKDDLALLVKQSKDPSKLSNIKDILLRHGIILLYLEAYPGMKVDGVSFLLDNDRPVIGMSLRFDRLDNYWFTLLHELSHLILHKEVLQTPLFDDIESEQTEDIEMEANGVALNTMIPRYKWRSCKLKYEPTTENVYSLADDMSIHPALVAGRYRKENNKYTVFSDIVNSINTREILL